MTTNGDCNFDSSTCGWEIENPDSSLTGSKDNWIYVDKDGVIEDNTYESTNGKHEYQHFDLVFSK